MLYRFAPARPPGLTGTPQSETVGGVFRRIAQGSSGQLNMAELQEALNALGLTSDTASTEAAMAKHATEVGSLDMRRFCQLVKELKLQGELRTAA